MPTTPIPTNGSQLIAQSLKSLNVQVIFGIVGIPVIEVAEACIALGIKFVSFRNEQAASYAASAYGFLTGRPGVCLVVGGPGILHAMAGVCISLFCVILFIYFYLLLGLGLSSSHLVTDPKNRLEIQQ